MNIDLNLAHDIAFKAAHKAGEILRYQFAKPIDVDMKGFKDFVTKLDKQCEELIREELAIFDDSISFFGEETTPQSAIKVEGDANVVSLPNTCWIVDPLDGTSNYVHGIMSYGVAISLKVDDEIVVGITNQPSIGKTYSAIHNEGAYVYDRDGVREQIAVQDRGEGLNLFAMSVPFWQPEFLSQHWKITTRLFDIFQDVRRPGSAACDLTWLADGTYGGYLARFLKPWDISAGGLIIKEAGGVVTDWDGNEKHWLESGKILAAASAQLHDKMLSLIK